MPDIICPGTIYPCGDFRIKGNGTAMCKSYMFNKNCLAFKNISKNNLDKWQMVDNLAQYKMFYESGLRCGQALFNSLSILDIKTANLIRGTEDDCFYNDNKMFQFRNKVFEIWNKE